LVEVDPDFAAEIPALEAAEAANAERPGFFAEVKRVV